MFGGVKGNCWGVARKVGVCDGQLSHGYSEGRYWQWIAGCGSRVGEVGRRLIQNGVGLAECRR